MLQILLQLKVLFISGLSSKICCVVLCDGSELRMGFGNCLFGLWFKPAKVDFKHDFTRMTDKADGSVVIAKL